VFKILILTSKFFETGHFFVLNIVFLKGSIFRSCLPWHDATAADCCRNNDISKLGDLYSFSVDHVAYGQHLTLDLKPGGRHIAVTENNKHEYTQSVKHFLRITHASVHRNVTA